MPASPSTESETERSRFDKLGEVTAEAMRRAIADGLAHLMEHEASGETGDLPGGTAELRSAAGLEERV